MLFRSKSLLLIEEMGDEGRLVSCDVSENRVQLIRKAVERMGFCLLYTSRGRRGHRQGAVPQLRGQGFPLRPPVRRIQRPRADPVSYTHLDVYKRQSLDSAGDFASAQATGACVDILGRTLHDRLDTCLLYTSRCV